MPRVARIILALCLLPCPAAAATFLVPAQYATIQGAVDACSATGDSVLVNTGAYPDSVMIDGKRIVLRAASAGTVSIGPLMWRNTALAPHCGGSVMLIDLQNGVSASGVTEEDGFPYEEFALVDCVSRGPVSISPRDHAAMLRLDGCQLLADVNINHSGAYGGGRTTVQRCSFAEASLTIDSGDYVSVLDCDLSGGGIDVWCEGALLRGNTVSTRGTAIRIFSDSRDDEIKENVVRNSAIGIDFRASNRSYVTNNRISACEVGLQSDQMRYSPVTGNVVCNCVEGAVFVSYGPDWEFSGNTIIGCSGDGVKISGLGWGDEILARNLVAGNQTGLRLSFLQTGFTTFTCNDVWANPGGNWIGMDDPTGTQYNFSADPLLCGIADCNAELAEGSPCLPPSSPCGLRVGALGQGCTPDATHAASWGEVKSLFR